MQMYGRVFGSYSFLHTGHELQCMYIDSHADMCACVSGMMLMVWAFCTDFWNESENIGLGKFISLGLARNCFTLGGLGSVKLPIFLYGIY